MSSASDEKGGDPGNTATGAHSKGDHAKEKAGDAKRLRKKHVVLFLGALVALALAYLYKRSGGKRELMQGLRDSLLSLQSLRAYGFVGWVTFILLFVAQLTVCLPGTMVVDVALGNIYGAALGTAASVTAKTMSALISLFLGRCFGKALGIEFPEMLKSRLGAVRTHPLKALLAARMAPISTGVKNYAFSLLPPEDVPLLQYALATILANLVVTTGVCVLGAGADNLVQALDNAIGSH